MTRKFLLPFAILTILLLASGYGLSNGAEPLFTSALMMGIVFLAMISLLTFFLSARFVNAENPNRFVRGIMGATFLKFFLCIIAALIWLLKSGRHLNKPDLFALMGVYIAYTVLESYMLSTASRKR